MVIAAGLEPATSGLGIPRSILMSYATTPPFCWARAKTTTQQTTSVKPLKFNPNLIVSPTKFLVTLKQI